MDTKYLIPENGKYRVRIPVAGSKVGCGTYDYEEAIRVRDRYLQMAEMRQVKGEGWTAEGLVAQDFKVDEEVVVRRAIQASAQLKIQRVKSEAQVVRFDSEKVLLVFAADQHCGGPGVDYERLYNEAKLIRETPDTYCFLLGDLLDNFIVPKLRVARDTSRFIITDEWALVRSYVRIVAPKVVGIVQGNHDSWTDTLGGIPYFQEVMQSLSPQALYDDHELWFQLHVGDHSWRVKLRHSWRGNSIWNATHAIERAARQDGDFDIGIGAHTHVGACVRTFSIGEQWKLAGMAGTYKAIDRYPRQKGFARAGDGTALAILVNGKEGVVTGFDNLDEAIRMMRRT